MRTLPLLVSGVLLGCGLATQVQAQDEPTGRRPIIREPLIKSRPPIDIVFAIDCSGSMGGVIETAKQKIWDIVNEAARAKPTPQLRIGLLAYGNGSNTYRQYDLSSDLDTVYQNLSTFKDEGWSEEYVGEAIQKAVGNMSWSTPLPNTPSLRSLYVVGNETARQGPIDFQFEAPRAKEKNIFVNAIYCGNAGGQDTWRQFSTLGGGEYLEIAADGASVMVPTPYDGPIDELNKKLNGTYLPYGRRGEAAASNQRAQDSNALRFGGVYANSSRALAKASSQYRNSEWDLVDKSLEPGFDLAKVPVDDLPPAMQVMTPEQRLSFLQKKQAERADLQKQLLDLGAKRAEFLRKANEKVGRRDSFDSAVNGSFGGQARAGGFGGFGGAGK